MFKKLLILVLMFVFTLSLSAQNQSDISIGETSLSLDTSNWIVQNDVDGYHAVLNSSEGIFDFMLANQYITEGEAVIAITDQSQFAEWAGISSQATDIASLASEIATTYSYAVDMEPEMTSSGSYDIYRLRINFGTLKQYAYVVNFDGLLTIFYLFTSSDTAPPPYETELVALIESVASSGSNSISNMPEIFARSMSNGVWVIYGAESPWVPGMNTDYHKLIMERSDEASGYLSVSFATREYYGELVFSQADAASIIMSAKGYNPPYEEPISTSPLTELTFGNNSAQAIEFAYADRSYVYHLFEFDGHPLLVIAKFENAHRDRQQAYVDEILTQLNDIALLENALKFAVASYEIETSTGISMTSFDIGFTRYSPFATIALTGENLAELFSIEMVSSIESGIYDLSGTAVTANYNIEVMLEGDVFAYANYQTNPAGTLNWESNGYVAGGSFDYTAELSGFIDPYTGQILEGNTTETLPPSITIHVTFADMEITGREYMP